MRLTDADALIAVDVQRDFLPGGSLAVRASDAIIPVLNRYIRRFVRAGLPVIASRDWHPPDHCSFEAQGGPWPPHCVRDTAGADFAPDLALPEDVVIVSKATHGDADAYSAFDGTSLAILLRAQSVRRLFVGGLATDYCVLATVTDGLEAGFDVVLLRDAVRAVGIEPGDEQKALEQMRGAGATFIDLAALDAPG
jgi:nicotinamidase/pyrazinamidase